MGRSSLISDLKRKSRWWAPEFYLRLTLMFAPGFGVSTSEIGLASVRSFVARLMSQSVSPRFSLIVKVWNDLLLRAADSCLQGSIAVGVQSDLTAKDPVDRDRVGRDAGHSNHGDDEHDRKSTLATSSIL